MSATIAAEPCGRCGTNSWYASRPSRCVKCASDHANKCREKRDNLSRSSSSAGMLLHKAWTA